VAVVSTGVLVFIVLYLFGNWLLGLGILNLLVFAASWKAVFPPWDMLVFSIFYSLREKAPTLVLLAYWPLSVISLYGALTEATARNAPRLLHLGFCFYYVFSLICLGGSMQNYWSALKGVTALAVVKALTVIAFRIDPDVYWMNVPRT
jgi:hypothetical protein